MQRKRFTEAQIAFALRQTESGTPVAEVIRKMGITEPTFYRWKKQFAGMGVAEIRCIKQLEDENARLKKLVADLTLDESALNNLQLIGIEGFYVSAEHRKMPASGE
jgi:putative transposase